MLIQSLHAGTGEGMATTVQDGVVRPIFIQGDALAQDLPSILDPTATRAKDSEQTPTAAVRGEPPRSMSEQLAGAIRAGGDGTFDLQLSPEELGRVRLTLTPGGTEILVTVAAERSETLDLMRRHIDLLAREFREQGYTSVQFSFGDDGGRERRGGSLPGGHATEGAAAREGPPMLETPHFRSLTPPADRLDLRL